VVWLALFIMTSQKDFAGPAGQAGNELVGFIHSQVIGGAVDGPGMRFVLFFSGCQMRCLYCHNPDTWDIKQGKKRTLEEMVTEVGKVAPFLKGGGLTATGGEPLIQPEFVHAWFSECKARYGVHTALDTNGLLSSRLPDEWFDAVDLVLLDIKQIDPEKHRRLTAVPLQPVLDFAERLARMNKPAWIRYVLVPGYSDAVEDVDRLADYIAGLKNVEKVELLPFHKMGEYKWKELNMTYELADVEPPDDELIERVREQFESRGLAVLK